MYIVVLLNVLVSNPTKVSSYIHTPGVDKIFPNIR